MRRCDDEGSPGDQIDYEAALFLFWLERSAGYGQIQCSVTDSTDGTAAPKTRNDFDATVAFFGKSFGQLPQEFGCGARTAYPYLVSVSKRA